MRIRKCPLPKWGGEQPLLLLRVKVVKIQLRYDRDRIGGYKITPVSSDAVKDNFACIVYRTNWDWRLAIGKLLASETYKDWAVRNPSRRNDMIVWYFKVVSPNGKATHLKLTNEFDYPTRCIIYGSTGDSVRGQRLYDFLRRELQDITPIEFMVEYRNSRGIGIEYRDGDLTTVAREHIEVWADQTVSRLVW